MNVLSRLAHRALLGLEPERAHALTLGALSVGAFPRWRAGAAPLATRVIGLDFPSPFGIAAGFDKNAEVPDALVAAGLGFVEVGTVTPRPQAGNPRPRVFRSIADRALVNRLGFNNEGMAAVERRLAARATGGAARRPGVVGVNIGANRDSADRIADYAIGYRTLAPVADYVTVNISSPNTPGLRDLQSVEHLDELLSALDSEREGMSARAGRSTPLLV